MIEGFVGNLSFLKLNLNILKVISFLNVNDVKDFIDLILV